MVMQKLVKRKVSSKPHSKTTGKQLIKRKVAPKTASKGRKITVTSVVVAAGPYPTQKMAEERKSQAAKIKHTQVGKITKTANGFTFPIMQRFAARTPEEKEKLVKMIHQHRQNAGVGTGRVQITHQQITV